MKWHLKEEPLNTCSFLEKKSNKMPQRKAIYKIKSYMEMINRGWSVTVPCCSTMTSDLTSRWQTESKQKDSVLTWSEGICGPQQCKTLRGSKGLPSFSLTEEKSVGKQLNTKIALQLWAAPQPEITGTEERTLGKFCHIRPVLKLLCRLFLIVRERFWTK